jgi:hypothetical protein
MMNQNHKPDIDSEEMTYANSNAHSGIPGSTKMSDKQKRTQESYINSVNNSAKQKKANPKGIYNYPAAHVANTASFMSRRQYL